MTRKLIFAGSALFLLIAISINLVFYLPRFSHEVSTWSGDGGNWHTEELFPVRYKEQWAYMDRRGKIAFKLKVDNASDFYEGLAKVWINHKCGYIDKTGAFVIHPVFDEGRNFIEGYTVVKQNGKYHFIDKYGKNPTGKSYNKVGLWFKSSAWVLEGDDVYNIRWVGGKVERSRRIHDEVDFSIDGLSTELWKNKETRPKIDPILDKSGSGYFPGYFSNGLAAANLSEKWGYINRLGKFEILPQFEFAKNFKEGMAAIVINNKWGYINMRGEITIQPIYEFASDFSEGIALVSKKEHFNCYVESIDSVCYYIDTSGRRIEPFE